MAQGHIRRLMSDRGFGFIRPVEEGQKDLFFHATQVYGVSFDELREGDSVSYTGVSAYPPKKAWCDRSYHQPQSGGALSQQTESRCGADIVASAEKDGRKHFPRHNHAFLPTCGCWAGVQQGRMPTPAR